MQLSTCLRGALVSVLWLIPVSAKGTELLSLHSLPGLKDMFGVLAGKKHESVDMVIEPLQIGIALSFSEPFRADGEEYCKVRQDDRFGRLPGPVTESHADAP